MKLAIFLILTVAICGFSVNGQKYFSVRCCEEYCFSSDPIRPQPQVKLFSTKTAYQFIRSGEAANPPSDCTATKFWLLSRHGTRLPSTKKINKLKDLPTLQKEVLDNYANGNAPTTGALCDADIALLTTWKWDSNITDDMDEYLTEQGWNDLKGIAQHYKNLYPNILGVTYSAEHFLFQHTNTQRTEASYKGFVDGLFGDGSYNNIPAPGVPERDTLLRPYDYCDAWLDQEAAIDDSTSELTLFEKSAIYKQVITDVSTKAGYSSALKASQVELMFEQCTYDQAWEIDKLSPWCTLFTEDQVKVFEYAKDIEDFYLAGTGSALNKKLTCELVADMLAKIENDDDLKTVAYFSHSATLQLFLTALGVAVDSTPLRADNYEQMANRQWRTSEISPFATNVAVIKYECSDGIKVQFFLNEKPLDLEWCDNGLCDWDDVKREYAEFATAECSTYFCS